MLELQCKLRRWGLDLSTLPALLLLWVCSHFWVVVWLLWWGWWGFHFGMWSKLTLVQLYVGVSGLLAKRFFCLMNIPWVILPIILIINKRIIVIIPTVKLTLNRPIVPTEVVIIMPFPICSTSW
jgi:hypothetical protein